MLSPLQKDALVEILNTHIGKAASSLSDMVNQKVILSVPEIELKISSDLNFYQFEKEGIFSNSEVVMSSIKFGNSTNGFLYRAKYFFSLMAVFFIGNTIKN